MIETQRLILRSGRREDLAALHAIFSDARAMRYWDRPPHTKIAETDAFLTQFMRNDPDRKLEFILEYEGTCIGKAGMWDKPEIGYILHPDHWRKGLATEAMEAILPMIWARFGDLPELTAELDPRNSASSALLRKFGFTLQRVEEKNFLYGMTEWCDTAYYTLPRPAVPLTTSP